MSGRGSLEEIGNRRGIPQAAADLDYLKVYDSVIAALPMPVTDIVMVLRSELLEAANTFAEAFPRATIHFLSTTPLEDDQHGLLLGNVRYTHCLAVADRVDYLRTMERPQVIIEHGANTRRQKNACFRQLFWALPEGGVYAIERLDAVHDSELTDDGGDNILDVLIKAIRLGSLTTKSSQKLSKAEGEIAACTGSIHIEDTLAVVRKAGEHLFKLRDWETNIVLAARLGDSWGEVLETRSGYSFESRAQVTAYGSGPIGADYRRTIDVPERHLRRYRNSTCSALQIVTLDGYFLPDTFRHPHENRQNHRNLAFTTSFLDRVSPRLAPSTHRLLDGEFFHFDTEFSGHFGHVATEVLSRYWGWKAAAKENPAIRPLIGLYPKQTGIPEFQARMFDMLGVPVDGIEYIQATESVQVESLVAATPQFENPYYVDLEMVEIWRELAANLPSDQSRTRSEKVFISRRPNVRRDCQNGHAVERFFSRRGFEIIYPEDHSYVEQAHMFAAARTIAGFGGSGMFNMMYAPHARIIILSGNSYKAANEYLFAAANGNEIHYFWGDSEVKGPQGRHTREAFHSRFTINLRKHKSALNRLLK